MIVHILTYFRKITFWLSTIIVSLLVILLLLLQTSFFQNYLAEVLVHKVNGQIRHQINFTNIKIKWFDSIEISGLEVFDYKGNQMIYVPGVIVDYELNQLFREGNLFFDRVTVQNGRLSLAKYQDTLGINLSEFIYDLNQLKKKPGDTVKSPPMLKVDEVYLKEFVLTYNNHLQDSLPVHRFDYGHFKLNIPKAAFDDFLLHADTIAADIGTFIASDPASGLTVEDLQAKFMLTKSLLSMQQMRLQTPHSLIQEGLELQFSGLGDLSYFKDSVQFQFDLKESRIAKKDISYFTEVPIADFVVDVSADISGSVPRLTVQNLRLKVGNWTRLDGDIELMGLPKLNETFIDANIGEGEIYPEDIAPYIGRSIENLRHLGEIQFSGRFLGFTNDFVARADFRTEEGFLSSDLNFKFPNDWKTASYSGKLVLKDFDVGALINEREKIQKVNLAGEIDGTGLTVENAKFFLNANFKDSGFFGYKFREIKAKGEFASQFFKGNLNVDDPNAVVIASGAIDLKNQQESIQVEADVGYLNLKNMGLVKDNLEISSKVEADVTGFNIDSLQGEVNLQLVNVHWKEDSVSLDSMKVSSYKSGSVRKVALSLPEMNLALEGDFNFIQVTQDLQVIVNEFMEYFEPDFNKRATLISEEVFDQYSIDFYVDYANINEYLDLISHEVYISPKGRVEGTYYQRKNATLSLFAEVDSINYQGIGYKNNTFDLNFSKDLDSLGIIASAFVISQRQTWRQIHATEDLAVEAVWFNNEIDLNMNIAQPANNSSAELKAEMKLARDKLVFSFSPSEIIVFGEQWFFNPYNKIEVTRQHIEVDRVELYQNTQSVLLEGTYSDSAATDLSLRFTDFDLTALNAVLPVDMQGVFSSDIELSRQGIATDYRLSGELDVENFGLNGFPLGDISGTSRWDDDKQALFIDLNVERESINTIDISGYYMPSDSINQLDVNANFNEASLVLLSPIVVGLASDIKGVASGNLNLSGTLEYPILNGEAELSAGRFTFDMLGTIYGFEGKVDFDNRAINFNGIRLVDRDGDLASLNGALRHRGFKNISADLRIAANDFMFLNTTSRDNSLYYGTANATGDITIRGPIEDLYIKAEAVTNKGTKIYIPLSGQEELIQKNYITFVDFSDTTSHVDLNQIVQQNIAGITLDFEIDITTDAYVEMIFDIRTGDIIRGRGEGNLHLSLDTNGEFEMFGDITIAEGAYNFTIPNLINKEFSIVPGSTISWYGDPMAGILNLEATYRQLASFSDLQPDPENGGIAEKHPILVVLELNGEMLSPSIDFEVRYDNSQGTLPTSDQLSLDKINNDEQELKRQVFSLLILRKFTQWSEFRMAGAPVQGSLSEFLSNQFSYYISQVDENLEVDFDLAALDQDAFNTFQLRLSYTFFDGRLRVSGGGAFAQNTPEGNATSNGDFVGDWSVRYLLTPDGHLRVRAFSQSEQFAGDWQRESGVSFQYLKSFDDLRELLTKTREEAIRTRPKDISKERQANQDKDS